MKQLIEPRTSVLAAFILTAAAWRIFVSGNHSPLTNFTPIGAMALFGGVYFSNKITAFIFPLLTLWASDIILNYLFYFHEWKLYYDGFLWTYGSFALTVFIGTKFKKVTARNFIVASVMSAFLHWLITDFGTWLDGRLYPPTPEGLGLCYLAAIPYLQNMLVANLLFGSALFILFERAQRRFPVLMSYQA